MDIGFEKCQPDFFQSVLNILFRQLAVALELFENGIQFIAETVKHKNHLMALRNP
jgi:hypothetical protein